MQINIIDLHRYFGSVKAVDGITFSFSSGQVFGFVGPNGAGKSSTMRILATLDEPTYGDATLDGISVVDYPEKAHRLVGYVPDNLPTHRDINVHEYLDFFARAYGIKGKRRKQVVEEIEEFCNLVGIREKFLNALSKGMKNRVSVARALVHDPPVLVMDEPAAGLDPRARIELRELLRALAVQGKAILISSHILTELAEICNGAVIIERGKILCAGTLDDIMEQAGGSRLIIIRPLERLQELYKYLLETPYVDEVQIEDEKIELKLTGSEETVVELLADLVRAKFPIIEFRQQKAGLEQIFMSVTRGEVQ